MASNDCGRHSSVTSMLTRLGWATLEQRRENQRLTMMYKVVMDWWQYPQLILPQQIPAPEQTTVLSFGLSVEILRLTSIPSFREPFLLGTSYQRKPPKVRPSMHSNIVFCSSAFHLHRRDIPSGSFPITFQIQVQTSYVVTVRDLGSGGFALEPGDTMADFRGWCPHCALILVLENFQHSPCPASLWHSIQIA